MPSANNWEAGRRRALKTLWEHLRLGRVDLDILPLLELINSMEDYYTTSSCSGRIQAVAYRLPGDKFSLRTLGKWHRPVRRWELWGAVSGSGEKWVWVAVKPPIIHVAARSWEAAVKMLNLAREAGFKHSGIVGVGRSRLVVEVTGSERAEFPVVLDGRLLLKPIDLGRAVPYLNELLLRGKAKLARLHRALGGRASPLYRGRMSKMYASGRRGSRTG